MKLSARLKAVAEYVEPYRTMADIGSDHAYVPVWLMQNEKIDFAVAGEIQQGPLDAAKRTIQEAALEGNIAARRGDGLEIIEPGEVDVVVIAGMGGSAIRRILERSPEITKRLKRLVCQPMIGGGGLRGWLQENAWNIVAENLVFEDGHLYEVIVAEQGKAQPMDELMLEIGPLLWQQRHPLLLEHLKRIKRQYEKRVGEMVYSQTQIVKDGRHAYQKKIEALEGKMEWLQTAE